MSYVVNVEAEFHAYFAFTVRDSIDRNYVTIGGARASTTKKLNVTIQATADRDEGEDPDALEVDSEP